MSQKKTTEQEENPNIPPPQEKVKDDQPVMVKVMNGLHYLPADEGTTLRAMKKGDTFQTTWGRAQTLKKASPTGKYAVALKK